jgi:excisionase family DNA binding protein
MPRRPTPTKAIRPEPHDRTPPSFIHRYSCRVSEKWAKAATQFPRRPLSGSPVNTGSLPLPQPKAHKLRFRRWYIAGLMSEQRYRLEQAFEGLRQALEAVESALLEYEETIHGEEAPDRSRQQQQQEEGGLDLLSIPEACQELGMGKSWVYQRLRSGEIPSLKLGKIIKIRREDLEEYLKSQYNPASSGEEGKEQP